MIKIVIFLSWLAECCAFAEPSLQAVRGGWIHKKTNQGKEECTSALRSSIASNDGLGKNEVQNSATSWLFSSSVDLTYPMRPSPKLPSLEPIKTLPSEISKLWYQHVPQALRFFISGRCGDVCLFFCQKLFTAVFATVMVSSASIQPQVLTDLLTASQDSISFLGGYFMHVVPQHVFHAALVYGMGTISTREKYFATLKGMYGGMLTSAVGSTALNTFLLQVCSLPKNTAFVMTLGIFSVINYFWIGWIVKQTERAQKGSSESITVSPAIVR